MVLFLLVCLSLIIGQFVLPKRLAFLPLLAGAMNVGNVEIVGQFTICRILIVCALLRAVTRGHFKFSLKNPLDVFALVFASVTMLSAFFHNYANGNPFMFRTGLVLNYLGTYLCGRAYLDTPDTFFRYIQWTAILLMPLGLMMAGEQATGRTFYRALGAHNEEMIVRDGKVRAQGPFKHPILAGTAGAASVPLMLCLWTRRRKLAIAGIAAGCLVTASTASSGPLAAMGAAVGALFLWRWRGKIRYMQGGFILMVFVMSLLINRPIWYLIAAVDLVGGSTGWHRAELIDSAMKHLDEWWKYGTDFTRHWMPSGVSWSPDHTDITNHYLYLGVQGGMPLMLTFIATLLGTFILLGKSMRRLRKENHPDEFLFWCIGCSLLAHTVSFISITYFDQMYVLLYLLVGAVPAMMANLGTKTEKAPAPVGPAPQPTVRPRPAFPQGQF